MIRKWPKSLKMRKNYHFEPKIGIFGIFFEMLLIFWSFLGQIRLNGEGVNMIRYGILLYQKTKNCYSLQFSTSNWPLWGHPNGFLTKFKKPLKILWNKKNMVKIWHILTIFSDSKIAISWIFKGFLNFVKNL